MPSRAQLEAQRGELLQKLDSFENNAEMTLDEKEVALTALGDEFDTWERQYKNCEAASNYRGKLAEGGDVKDANTGKSIVKYECESPFTTRNKKMLAAEIVQDPRIEEKLWSHVNGHRQEYDFAFEIGLKDASASGNLMGEGLYGTAGPGATGQTPFNTTGAFGYGIQPDWRPGIVEHLFYKITLPDLFSSFATTSPNLSYLTENTLTLNANEVAESATYPYSSVTVARTYAQIGKIANAMTLSDEAIADAPTLYNFAQGRMLESLQRQEEVQILAASGYPGVAGLFTFASSFTGSSSGSYYGATSGTGTNVAFPPAGTNGAYVVPQVVASLPYGRVITGQTGVYPTPIYTALNLKDAFVDLELAVFESPNAIVMHPRDWQILETAQDGNGQFMNGSFFGSNYGVRVAPVRSIWDVPVITTPFMPKGVMLAGWFDARTVQLARRQGISMQMTNSNGTDFVQGNITMRAEERLGLLCYRPTAFQLIHLVNG